MHHEGVDRIQGGGLIVYGVGAGDKVGRGNEQKSTEVGECQLNGDFHILYPSQYMMLIIKALDCITNIQ